MELSRLSRVLVALTGAAALSLATVSMALASPPDDAPAESDTDFCQFYTDLASSNLELAATAEEEARYYAHLAATVDDPMLRSLYAGLASTNSTIAVDFRESAEQFQSYAASECGASQDSQASARENSGASASTGQSRGSAGSTGMACTAAGVVALGTSGQMVTPSAGQGIPVAARDLEALKKVGQVQPIGQRDMANAVKVVRPDGSVEVWVNPGYSDYEGTWEAVKGPRPTGTDIDHIQSKARALQQGYGYVRVEAVDSQANQDAGRSWEKRTVRMGERGYVEPRGVPEIRNADPVQRTKLQGIQPGNPGNGYAGVRSATKGTSPGPATVSPGFWSKAGTYLLGEAAAWAGGNFGAGIAATEVGPNGETVSEFYGDRLYEALGHDFWTTVGDGVEYVEAASSAVNKALEPAQGCIADGINAIIPDDVLIWADDTITAGGQALQSAGKSFGTAVVDVSSAAVQIAEENGGGLGGYLKGVLKFYGISIE